MDFNVDKRNQWLKKTTQKLRLQNTIYKLMVNNKYCMKDVKEFG